MRPDPMRAMLLALSIALVAGCASGPTEQSDVQRASTHSAMSNKGLANLSLAQNYLAADKMEYALDRALRALRSDPGSADVQVVLGMIRERLGDSERAGEHFQRGVKLGPESGHVLNAYAAWLCQKGQAGEADALFARAIKDPFYKARDQALFNAGKCALRAGDHAKAEQYLRQGLAASPENPSLLSSMAELQFRQGNFMSARAFYQRGEALGKPSAEMLDLAARIELGAGDTVAAQRYQQRLREQYPDYTPPATEGLRQP